LPSLKTELAYQIRGLSTLSFSFHIAFFFTNWSSLFTEQNSCYENPITERAKGILKDEFYLDQTFDSVANAKSAAKNGINLYNEVKLHLSLDYKTPNMVYKLSA